jgi:hypothetical protein
MTPVAGAPWRAAHAYGVAWSGAEARWYGGVKWVKILVGALLFVAVLAVTALGAVPRRSVVRFMKPTIIAGAAMLGSVVFEHDDDRMARRTCKVYHYDAKHKARGDVIVEFHCMPKDRPVATSSRQR